MRRLSPAVLVATLAACAPAARQGPAPAPTAAPAARLLLINDVYVVDTLRDGSGGLARVAALRDSLEQAAGGRVLFVLAGDFLSPSLLSKWYGGRQMVDALGAARLDYATFGNHEFELDRDSLVARVAASRFRWLAANCTEASGRPFPGVRAWDTVTVRGARVGLFGLTLPGDYRGYVRCASPDSAARASVAALRAVGATYVVALTHQTLGDDTLMVARVPGIDLVLGGHEHEWHEVRAATPAGPRLVLKADANSRSAQYVTLSGGSAAPRAGFRRLDVAAPRPFDPATQAVVRAWADTLVRRLGPERVVGTAPAPLDARDAVQRANETVLGDLVTDALRLGTGADVALLNSGAMRLDDVLRAGPVTNYQLESIFLFADETRAVTFPLTGARLRAVLEHGVSARNLGRGGYLQLSGVRFRYDPARPTGARLVGDVTRDNGRVVGPGDTLRVTFIGYPACAGGDGYQIPEAAAACAALAASPAAAPRTVDLLMAHVARRLGGTFAAPAGGRITRVGAGATGG